MSNEGEVERVIVSLIQQTFDVHSDDTHVHEAEHLIDNMEKNQEYFSAFAQIATNTTYSINIRRSSLLYIMKFIREFGLVYDFQILAQIINDSVDFVRIYQKLADIFIIYIDKNYIFQSILQNFSEEHIFPCLYLSASFSAMFSNTLKDPFYPPFIDQIIPLILQVYQTQHPIIKYLCHLVFERCLFIKDESSFSNQEILQSLVNISLTVDINESSLFPDELFYSKMSMLSSLLQMNLPINLNIHEFSQHILQIFGISNIICPLYYPIYVLFDDEILRSTITEEFFQLFLESVYFTVLDQYLLQVDESFYGYSLFSFSENTFTKNWSDPVTASSSIAEKIFKKYEFSVVAPKIIQLMTNFTGENARLLIIAMWFLSKSAQYIEYESISLLLPLIENFLSSDSVHAHNAAYLFISEVGQSQMQNILKFPCDFVGSVLNESLDSNTPEEVRCFALNAIPHIIANLTEEEKSAVSSELSIIDILSLLIQNYCEKESDTTLSSCKNLIKFFPEVINTEGFADIFTIFTELLENSISNEKWNASRLLSSTIALITKFNENNSDFISTMIDYINHIVTSYIQSNALDSIFTITESLFNILDQNNFQKSYELIVILFDILQNEECKLVIAEFSQSIINFIHRINEECANVTELLVKANSILENGPNEVGPVTTATEIIASFFLNLGKDFFQLYSPDNIVQLITILAENNILNDCTLFITSILINFPEILQTELRSNILDAWTSQIMQVIPFFDVAVSIKHLLNESEIENVYNTAKELIESSLEFGDDIDDENIMQWPWFTADKNVSMQNFQNAYGPLS